MYDSHSEIRKELSLLLQNSHAHMTIFDAVIHFPMEKINETFINGTYSAWDLLEHINKTQNDILDFIKHSDYKEPLWPNDYWPQKSVQATPALWQKTIDQYKEDLASLEKLVTDEKVELFTKIPQGSGQTIFREILLVADHTSYHIGEFAIMRQVMHTWEKGHK